MEGSKVKADLLKDWDAVRQSIKRGLERLGHDILIECMDPEGERRKGSAEKNKADRKV